MKEIKEMFGVRKKSVCEWCGKEIESAHVSGKSNVRVSFCSSGCVDDWEAHVE